MHFASLTVVAPRAFSSHCCDFSFSQKISIWVNKVNRISVSVWGCAAWKNFPAMAYARTSAGPAGRPARSMHIPVPMQNFCTSPFPIWKSLIGRFSNRKWRPWGRSWWNWLFYLKEMRFALDRYGSRGNFFFEKQSFIDFHKELSESENSARPRCDFIYTKNSARPGSGFYLHKE